MIVALAGGVGGAKMAHGLAMAASPSELTVIVNTADDFDLFGLRICPDLDTVMYTLGGLANPVTGWGIEGDTRQVLDAIEGYQGESWFLIGDRDFATHLVRTERLTKGDTLSAVTEDLCKALGIESEILPMTDDRVATVVGTADGQLSFQDYFVRRKQEDEVVAFGFDGAGEAEANPTAISAIASAELVVINPSNPIVSIGPILAVGGYEQALRSTSAPRVAISPIIGGKALKGPADRMLASLGHESSALGVARIYQGLVDGFVIDHADRDLTTEIEKLGMRMLVTNAIMLTMDDRRRLGEEVIEFGATVKSAVAHS